MSQPRPATGSCIWVDTPGARSVIPAKTLYNIPADQISTYVDYLEELWPSMCGISRVGYMDQSDADEDWTAHTAGKDMRPFEDLRQLIRAEAELRTQTFMKMYDAVRD